VPLTATLTPGSTPAPGAVYNSGSLEAFDRPNYVGGQPLYPSNKGPARWFNPQAFARQSLGFGNLGRNVLTAPALKNVDISLAKNTKIRESVSVQFRAETFNLLNHPNFTQPINSFTSTQFGQITATRAVRGDLSSSRQIQLGLKLMF